MALILSRRVGESILIDGDKIKIVVTEIQDQQVRLGIEAPKDVEIWREELVIRKQSEKKHG